MLTAPRSKSSNGKIQLMYNGKGSSRITLFQTLWDYQFGNYFSQDEIKDVEMLRDQVKKHEERRFTYETEEGHFIECVEFKISPSAEELRRYEEGGRRSGHFGADGERFPMGEVHGKLMPSALRVLCL